MPYNYTPTPVYTVPVQLASDGDPASSATIMGPIEAALDNIAAVYQLGAERIRSVPTFAALRALTGMAHNDVALVATAGEPGWEEGSWGIFRFVAGTGSEINNIWQQDADDGSGQWVWIDYSRANQPNGFPVLNGSSQLVVGTGCTALAIGADSWLQTGADVEVRQGTSITLAASDNPLITPGGVLRVQAGQDSPLSQRGGIIVEGGGRVSFESGSKMLAESGSQVDVEGELVVSSAGYLGCYGSLVILPGGALGLQERIRHQVIRYANGLLNGTPIAITASTADEHILGETPAAPTTIALADPNAPGLRVRFSRTSIAHSATHLTVTASGVSYILSGGGGDLQWLELVSAYNGATPTWYPSQYAVH